jgi:hypothetical protein
MVLENIVQLNFYILSCIDTGFFTLIFAFRSSNARSRQIGTPHGISVVILLLQSDELAH